MKIVLALGMSRPLSTMVVASRMSKRAVDKIDHHPFQLAFAHLTVTDRDAGFGDDVLQFLGDGFDVLHAIVHEVDLPFATQFAQDRIANQLVAPARHARFDGHAIFGRRFEIRDIADADQRHVQRARNRRGTERQHVDRRPNRLQPLFDFDAEPLFFVDDQQSQVVEFDVLGRQAMGADDDIDAAGLQGFDRLALFLRRAEAAELGDRKRKLGHPFDERPIVLFGQDRRGHQHGDLISVVDGLEGGPHGHFGLAKPDVAADQAIHRARGCACRP